MMWMATDLHHSCNSLIDTRDNMKYVGFFKLTCVKEWHNATGIKQTSESME